MKALRAIFPIILTGICCSLSLQAQQNLFVDLGEVAGAAPGTVTIDSPLGAGSGTWQYSAAAPVAGTTWNVLPRVTTSTLTLGQAGNPNISSAPGDYYLYSSAISLVDSLGNATLASINMISHYAGTNVSGSTRESIQFNNNAGAIPEPLMGNNWRDQNFSGSTGPATTWEFIFSGLTPGLSYNLYFYGSGNTAAQGVTGTLGALNGGATAITTGIAAPTSIFDAGQTTLVSQGTGWNVLNGVVDPSGNLSFTASRSAGQFFLNGFQLVQNVPEPSVAALVGVGLLGAIARWRKRI
jgi:hypothetical protein